MNIRHDIRGNALVLIMVAIFLIGLLAKNVIEKDLDTNYIADQAELKAQLAKIRNHETNLNMATQTVLNNGTDPANIDDIIPSEAGFDTSPHAAKIYHPYGGGVQYIEDYQGWNDIQINYNTTITNLGPTAGVDIIAVGDVSEELCDALSLSPATVVTQVAIDALQADTSITLDDSTTCTAGICDSIDRQCVRNAGGTEFVFYTLLHAQ
mgnify:CR=1 FL=1